MTCGDSGHPVFELSVLRHRSGAVVPWKFCRGLRIGVPGEPFRYHPRGPNTQARRRPVKRVNDAGKHATQRRRHDRERQRSTQVRGPRGEVTPLLLPSLVLLMQRMSRRGIRGYKL